MERTTMRVALLVYDLFEQAEFEGPLAAFHKAGVPTRVISAGRHKKLQAMQHNHLGDTFQADDRIDTVRPNDFNALVLPGGVLNADQLRMVEAARSWVNEFVDNGRLIAAICHAPWLLVSADVVEERRLTSYFTLQDDIRNAGGEWVDRPVVVDDNLITSRTPGDLPKFNKAILSWLKDSDPVTRTRLVP